MASAPEPTDVLIVGAGPVGLALAIELGMRGIGVELIEQNPRAAPQPRAKTTNVRSMEHMRRWGIADALRASAPLPADYPTDIIFATRLYGQPLVKIENGLYGARVRDERFSEPAQWIPQYKVEAALRSRIATLASVTLHSAVQFDALRQDASHVEADITDLASGSRSTLAASYLVGADGARSPVRAALDISMEGRHAYGFHYNYVIRAPALRDRGGQDRAIMYWLVNPDSPAITGPMDAGDLWHFGITVERDAPAPTEAEAKARMCRAFGRNIDIEIVVTDPWAAHSLVADRYGAGRVVLAGDACHLHPPFGGYGMNLGLGDSVDLGWKLAALVQGWGGEALLASYEAERRPAHQRVIGEAVANHAVLTEQLVREGIEAPGPVGDAVRAAVGERIVATKTREFRSLGVVLGTTYSGSPIVVSDGSAAPEEHFSEYQASAHPGCLAPHLWLADGRSLYDLFGLGFVLLVTDDGPAGDVDELVVAARQAAMPLTVVAPGDPRLPGLYQARLALIRPDQHVAWRGDRLDRSAAALLETVRGATP